MNDNIKNKLDEEGKMVICFWPDDQWCFMEDIWEYDWKSDDYTIHYVPEECTEDDIDVIVMDTNNQIAANAWGNKLGS